MRYVIAIAIMACGISILIQMGQRAQQNLDEELWQMKQDIARKLNNWPEQHPRYLAGD